MDCKDNELIQNQKKLFKNSIQVNYRALFKIFEKGHGKMTNNINFTIKIINI
jgi:hypothetical protein